MVKADDLILEIWEYYEYKEELGKKTDQQLIKRLKELQKKFNDTDEQTYEEGEEATEIENELAERFGFISRDIFKKWQEDFAKNIADELERIEARLRNHRHDTTRNFSSKPEF